MAGQRRGRDRAEARLWTGPLAHLVGGALDVLSALAGYGLARLKGKVGRRSMPASRAREAGDRR